MANTIKIKNSGTASSAPSSLEHGELAINYRDGKIFYKNHLNSITSVDTTLIANDGPTKAEILAWMGL